MLLLFSNLTPIEEPEAPPPTPTPPAIPSGPLILDCPEPGDMVEAEIHRVGTQYRESPNLLGLMRTYLGQVEEIARTVCAIPSYFDIRSAVGDQLTLLGKRLGWPRCHCVCDVSPVFGFKCEGEPDNPLAPPIVGFCEGGIWIDCPQIGNSDICLNEDEVYRGYLMARRYQMLGLYDIASLETALRHIWGATAWVVAQGNGRVVLAPGRTLTATELRELPLVIRVMPIAPGIRATVHFGIKKIFGFGEGWGGFCEDAEWVCETDPHAYSCEPDKPIFGFGDGYYGFCEDAQWSCA